MTHNEKIKNICEQLKAQHKTGQPLKLQKSSVSHFVPNPYDKRSKLPKIDIKSLNQIINIDEEFFDWYKVDFNFYPLWIVPYKPPHSYPWINDKYAEEISDDLFIDCAIYGKVNTERNKDYSELLENKTFELKGLKTLISRNHFDEKTFWKVYNRQNYFNVKEKTDPQNLFNDLYNKFKPSNYC